MFVGFIFLKIMALINSFNLVQNLLIFFKEDLRALG